MQFADRPVASKGNGDARRLSFEFGDGQLYWGSCIWLPSFNIALVLASCNGKHSKAFDLSNSCDWKH